MDVSEIYAQIEELATPGADLLFVDVARQAMRHFRGGTCLACYAVSTAARGVGAVQESFCTPPGLHRVVERYGDGEPEGRVFFERRATAACVPSTAWCEGSGRDLILTRILRLDGMEPGVNRGSGVDTYRRYIYLHGADNEAALGQTPVSAGCIHVGNADIVALFDATQGRDLWCWIGEAPSSDSR